MNKCSFFITVLLCLFYQPVTGQISLTSEDISQLIGNTGIFMSDTTGNITVDVGSAGENRVWDFSEMTTDGFRLDFRFTTPEGSPFYNLFPASDFLIEEHLPLEEGTLFGYSYYDLDPSAFIFLGYGWVDTASGYSEAEEDPDITPLPIEYGDQWTNVETDTFEIYPGAYNIGMDSSIVTIDAWGTIITPAGSFECLRLQDRFYSIDHTYYDTVLVYSDTTSGIDYEWIGPEYMIFASTESMDNENNPNYTTAESFMILVDTISTIPGEPVSPLSSGFELRQNFPNPFNPETSISFYLHRNGHADLSIYDINGRRVANPLSGQMIRGSHTVIWNAADLASGVYIYRLRLGSEIRSRKYMLIR